MFDLDINNYSKNELEGLLDLSNKKYTREDVENSTTTLQGQIKSNNTVDDATRDKTSLFLIKMKDALAGFMESRDDDQFLAETSIQN